MEAAQLVYIKVTRLALKSSTYLSKRRISELNTNFGELRLLLSCVVCCELLTDPYEPKGRRCGHYVCRLCMRGRKRLFPRCKECYDCCNFRTYEESEAMALQLLCYKAMCTHLMQTTVFTQLYGLRPTTLPNQGDRKPRIHLPDWPTQWFIQEGANYDDMRDIFLSASEDLFYNKRPASLPSETPPTTAATTPELPYEQHTPEQMSINGIELEAAATGEEGLYSHMLPMINTEARMLTTASQQHILVDTASQTTPWNEHDMISTAEYTDYTDSNWSEQIELPGHYTLPTFNGNMPGYATYVIPSDELNMSEYQQLVHIPQELGQVAPESVVVYQPVEASAPVALPQPIVVPQPVVVSQPVGVPVAVAQPTAIAPCTVIDRPATEIPPVTVVESASVAEPLPVSQTISKRRHAELVAEESWEEADQEELVAVAQPIAVLQAATEVTLVEVAAPAAVPASLPVEVIEPVADAQPLLDVVSETSYNRWHAQLLAAESEEEEDEQEEPVEVAEPIVAAKPTAAAEPAAVAQSATEVEQVAIASPLAIEETEPVVVDKPLPVSASKTSYKRRHAQIVAEESEQEEAVQEEPVEVAQPIVVEAAESAVVVQSATEVPPVEVAVPVAVDKPLPVSASKTSDKRQSAQLHAAESEEEDKQEETVALAPSAREVSPVAVSEPVAVASPLPVQVDEPVDKPLPVSASKTSNKRRHAQIVAEESSEETSSSDEPVEPPTRMKLRNQKATIISSVQVKPPTPVLPVVTAKAAEPVATRTSPLKSTPTSAFKASKPKDARMLHTCRCGTSSAPGRTTCRNSRCTCYVAGKSCVNCKCVGCKNPHEFTGVSSDEETEVEDVDETDSETELQYEKEMQQKKKEKQAQQTAKQQSSTAKAATTPAAGKENDFTLVFVPDITKSKHPIILVQDEGVFQPFNMFHGNVPGDPALRGWDRILLQNSDAKGEGPTFAYIMPMVLPPATATTEAPAPSSPKLASEQETKSEQESKAKELPKSELEPKSEDESKSELPTKKFKGDSSSTNYATKDALVSGSSPSAAGDRRDTDNAQSLFEKIMAGSDNEF